MYVHKPGDVCLKTVNKDQVIVFRTSACDPTDIK